MMVTDVKRIALWLLRASLGRERAEAIAYAYRDRVSPPALTYRFGAQGRRSVARLRALQNAYRGRRCFIIANGPSIADMDLTVLRNELTFGLNRGYLLFDRIGAPTTFLVAVNRHVIEQFAPEMLATQSLKFFTWQLRSLLPEGGDPLLVRSSQGPRFCRDVAREGVWEGATVTYVAMQLAYYMGFDEVVLIGVDHSFTSTGPPHQLVTSESADPNHFDPRYFGPGVKWQLPDLQTSEIAYRLARGAFEDAGRRIVDATVGGRLTVFPKVDYTVATRPR